MLRGIFFDLGLTLIHSPKEEMFAALLKEEGIECRVEEVKKAFFLTTRYFMREHPGVLTDHPSTFFGWFLEELSVRLGIQLQSETLKEKIYREFPSKEEWRPFQETYQVLKELKERDFRLGLISNWDSTAYEILDHLSLTCFFNPLIISSQVGIEKPDPRIFRLAVEESGLRPEEILYVGDNYDDDIVGSRGVGMRGVLINRHPEYYHEERAKHIIHSLEELLDWDSLESLYM